MIVCNQGAACIRWGSPWESRARKFQLINYQRLMGASLRSPRTRR